MPWLSSALTGIGLGSSLLQSGQSRAKQGKYQRAQRYQINKMLANTLPSLEKSAREMYGSQVDVLRGLRDFGMRSSRMDVSAEQEDLMNQTRPRGTSGFANVGQIGIEQDRMLERSETGYELGIEDLQNQFQQQELGAFSEMQGRLEELEQQRQTLLTQRAGLMSSNWTEGPVRGTEYDEWS